MSTATTWIETHIANRILSPAARAMTPEDAALQHNEAAALTTADADYLYTPSQAQAAAQLLLDLVGITALPGQAVVLTDTDDTGSEAFVVTINPSQLEAAAGQHRLITGDAVAADALIGALPWA